MVIIVICIVLAVAAAIAILKMKQSTADDGLRFARQEALFSPAERSFLGVLEQSLDSSYRVFGKVRLGDIVKPAKGLSNSKRATSQNKINQKHVDFVVCAAADLAVVGVVELDDKSHERGDRAGRDQFVDRALADAKIPVVHFPAKKGYALPEVRAKLAEGLAIWTAPSPPPVIQAIPVTEKPATILKKASEPVTEIPATAPVPQVKPMQEAAVPVCPKCASAMVKRQAAKGPHAGKFFWACTSFPKCRQVVAVGDMV